MRKTICEWCKKEFEQKSRWSKQQNRFCCFDCSVQYQKSLNLTVLPVGTKVCSSCGVEKELSQFHLKRTSESRQSHCIQCRSTAQMIRWNKQKVRAIAYLGGKCQKCGSVEHPINFDFHHREEDTKEFGWNIMRRRSWDKIVKELDKCDLTCVRCHRLTHHDPRLWKFTESS